jgi:hypothetical protein
LPCSLLVGVKPLLDALEKLGAEVAARTHLGPHAGLPAVLLLWLLRGLLRQLVDVLVRTLLGEGVGLLEGNRVGALFQPCRELEAPPVAPAPSSTQPR